MRPRAVKNAPPHRIGLNDLKGLFDDILEGHATLDTIDLIEKTAENIYLSADCAIGYETAATALTTIRAFRDDSESHLLHHTCGFKQSQRVFCASSRPAGVDIPGYISLVEAGRYTDAVHLTRKDNPLPLVCEHPSEIYCHHGMVDDPMNIRDLKRYAADHQEKDYRPWIAKAIHKRIAIIGGGLTDLFAAYRLAIMDHDATIFETRKHLGSMLRYGIPNYRLPNDLLEKEIQWILDCGIKVHRNTPVRDLDKLRREYNVVYIAIGAQSNNALKLEG